jgi:hypothetical protein
MIPLTLKRKLLVATPIKNGCDSSFLNFLVPYLKTKYADMETDFLVVDGPSVNFARDEAAYRAVEGGFTDLLQVDDDMGAKMAHVDRILSFDVDLVGGIYCKRRPGKPFWLFVPRPNAEKQPNGLLECSAIATGFMRVKVEALVGVQKAFPEREFACKHDASDDLTVRMEWFPMGVVGPRTAEARLEKVKEILAKLPEVQNRRATIPMAFVSELRDAIYSVQPAGRLIGEDYGVCRLFRKAGYKCWADVDGAIIPHVGFAAYPITPDMVGFGPGVPQALPNAEDL